MRHKPLLIKSCFILLTSFLGIVFLYSGYTKSGSNIIPGIPPTPIEPFEFTFVDLGIVNWRLAPFVARFMIGLEFVIGFLLLFNLYIRRFTMKLALATLALFSLYLVFIIVKEGNHGNCGCFGNALVMTPAQALVKNGVMILLCLLIYRYYEGFQYGRFTPWLAGLIVIGSLALPHILNLVDFDYSRAYLDKPTERVALPLDSLYKHATVNTPPQSLRKGKQVIAFMSLTCPHCRIAAKKMRLMKQKNPAIPMYLVLNGEKENLPVFFEDTRAENIPFCQLNGRSFVYLAGLNMPMIYLVNNTIVENYVNYMELDQAEIEKWLAQP